MVSICLLIIILKKVAAERNSKYTADKTEEELPKTKGTQLADKKTGNDVSERVCSLMCTLTTSLCL